MLNRKRKLRQNLVILNAFLLDLFLSFTQDCDHLMIEKLVLHWKGNVKGVKVNGARNIGQGHRVKVPA